MCNRAPILPSSQFGFIIAIIIIMPIAHNGWLTKPQELCYVMISFSFWAALEAALEVAALEVAILETASWTSLRAILNDRLPDFCFNYQSLYDLCDALSITSFTISNQAVHFFLLIIITYNIDVIENESCRLPCHEITYITISGSPKITWYISRDYLISLHTKN